MNERAFLAQLESANTEELTQILRRPTAEEERVLEIYFGRERLQRLRGLSLRTQQRAKPQGNVVVLHGITGGEMTVYPENDKDQYIWLSYPRLAIGAVGWLRMIPKTNGGYPKAAARQPGSQTSSPRSIDADQTSRPETLNHG